MIWQHALESLPHDIYHLPGYSRLCARSDESPQAFVASSGPYRMLVPFLKRSLPPELANGGSSSDATSPYGYSGPVWSTGAPNGFVDDSLNLLSETLKDSGVVAAYFRLHPLLNFPHILAKFGKVARTGTTVVIDLSLSDHDLWQRTRDGHRREIKASERQGYVASIDDKWESLDDFVRCYRQTMNRVQAKAYYHFPKQYFLDFRACLSTYAKLCVVRSKGVVVCAGIFTEIHGLGQNHLVGVADDHVRANPSKLMLHFQRAWLKARGNRFFHLGGGVGSQEDSLFQYKYGFSRTSLPYFTWHVICDVDRYDALVRKRRSLNNEQLEQHGVYFPEYRNAIDEKNDSQDGRQATFG